MLPAVTVDPSVIWMIDATDSIEAAKSAILCALEWMRPNATGPLDLCLSRRSFEAVVKADAFPAERRFAEVLAALGLQGVISPKDLASSVSRFLANFVSIEEIAGVRDVLYRNTSITPDPTVTIINPDLQLVSVEAMGLTALCARETRRHSIYGFPRRLDAHQRIQVATQIDILDLGEHQQRTNEMVEMELNVLRSPSEWPHGLSSLHIWREADCSADLEVAIWLEASAQGRKSGCGVREFRVGSAFLETIQESGAAGDGQFAEVTLSKCAQTVLLQSSLTPQPFRKNSKASAPTRERQRDKAKAWRLHVTKSHEALRLMYWELPNGHIEFATLEAKSEEAIHEGDVLAAAWTNSVHVPCLVAGGRLISHDKAYLSAEMDWQRLN